MQPTGQTSRSRGCSNSSHPDYAQSRNVGSRQVVKQMLTQRLSSYDWSLTGSTTAPGTELASRAAAQSTSGNVWKGLSRASVKSKLIPLLNVAGRVSLAAGAFQIGWKVGSLFVKAKAPAPVVSASVNPKLDWKEGGWTSINGTTMPAGGGFFLGTDCGTNCFADNAWSSPSATTVTEYGVNHMGHCGSYSVRARVPDSAATSGFTERIIGTFDCASVGGVGTDVAADYYKAGGLDPVEDSVKPYEGETVTATQTASGAVPSGSLTDAQMNEWANDPANEEAVEWVNEQLGAPEIGSFAIPAPEVGETYDTYVARLVALGHVGTITRVDLTDTTMVATAGPNAVTGTIPATGTTVGPSSEIAVRVNPATAPPIVEGGGGGSCESWTNPNLNLSPLQRAIPENTFPFYVPVWIYESVSNWVGTAVTPEFTLPFPGGNEVEISLEMFDSAAAVIRPVILGVSIVSLGLAFFSFANGGSRREQD